MFSLSLPCAPPLFQVLCTLIAAFLHFFFLSSFCWVLTEAWQSYMAVTGRLRNRIIRKRFLCLGWGGPSVRCASRRLSGLSHFSCVNVNFLFLPPSRSPCTSSGDLSGIHQGKGIWNTKLVSMLSYKSLVVYTSTSLTIYAGTLHMVVGLCLQHN